MSNFFKSIFITCDTREQSALVPNRKTKSAIIPGKFLISDYTEAELVQLAEKRPRIFSVYNHFSRKGAEVGISKLERCDYAVTGYHRGQEISLGVEYKQLSDFFGSHEDLPWKLWESAELYDSVGLFVEGKIDIEECNGFDFIRNYSGPNTLRYDLYQARMAEWSGVGIHCRQFDKIGQFASSLDNLLDYITKQNHRSVQYRERCPSDLVLKILVQIPDIKINTVSKLLKDNSSMSFGELVGHDVDWLKKRIGKVTGQRLWGVLHGDEVHEQG